MTVTTPPVAGQQPWDQTMNGYLAYLEARIATLEGQPNGAVMSFNFAPTTNMARMARAGFPPGQLSLDNTDQASATTVLASTTTLSGANARLALQSVVPGTVLVLQQTAHVSQYALAVVSGDPVDNGDHFALPVSSLALASQPLVAGMTGLSAAGISGDTAALQAQVATNTAAITDLQARVAVLEALPPPIPDVSTTTVTSITPNSGPFRGGTSVTIKGTGFNSFGAYQAGLATIGSWFIMTDFVVIDDNTITATTAPTTDGTGVNQLAVFFNAADAVTLANAFTYT